MEKIIKKIVLTGGPCAGKSSSLELIKNYLSNSGYLVYIVQESATELINSGIKPFGENSIDLIKFQEIILKYQLDKELLIENVAKTYDTDKDIIIIYDRGIIDYKAYIGRNNFDELLKKYNLSEKDILNKYDLVIHLETAAKSEGYTKENNKARSESRKEAIELDSKIYESWKIHKNLVKIKSNADFKEKQNNIITVIDTYINQK